VSLFDKFRKKKVEYELFSSEIPLSTIMRWYLYDTALGVPNELAEIIGLNKVSEEGEEKEVEESAYRVARLAPLLPFIDAFSNLSAEAMTALHTQHLAEVHGEVDEEEEEEMFLIYKVVALSTLIGTVAAGLELGVLKTDMISSDVLEVRLDTDE
jgi:hypothetical protein